MILTVLSNAKAIGAVAAGAVLVYFIYDYVNTKGDLIIAEANNITLTESLDTQSAYITNLENNIMKVKDSLLVIDNTARRLNEENEDLKVKFDEKSNGDRRDLGLLASKKSKLIQKIVNRATVKVNRCFELATGATLKEGEKNSECKELVKISK